MALTSKGYFLTEPGRPLEPRTFEMPDAPVGIMNGDIIQKVNGYDINSPEKALQVYSMLKNEKKISIDVVRNGRPKSFEYEIR